MYRKYIKRLLDIILSLIGLPFVGLAIVLFAPFIWLTDKGTVFYTAPRRGFKGKIFKMYKLRSMYMNAPVIKNEDGSTLTSDSDPRVTKIGRILRKTSVDELPQLLNVLKGDMSFIGPRPTVPSVEYDLLDPLRKKRLEVRPGVTGYSQAYYRNSITQEEKYKCDAYYVDHLSFVFDIKILLKTISSVIRAKNINANS